MGRYLMLMDCKFNSYNIHSPQSDLSLSERQGQYLRIMRTIPKCIWSYRFQIVKQEW